VLQLKNIDIGFHSKLFSIPEMELESGKLYTLIGKNGAGKSTFFQSLLKQVKVLKGEVLLQSNNINNLSINNLAKSISFVSSRFDGVQHLHVYDYIALGRSPYTNLIGSLGPEDHTLIATMIEKLGITALQHKDTTQLSDGERQICAISKALVQQTPILLLDEPSAFLDYANRIKILVLLKKLAKELQLCIIQSSHDLELSLEYSDEFLVIDDKTKELVLLKNQGLSKNDLIERAFGL
jgi:iron complex transport system ATP-binding protein